MTGYSLRRFRIVAACLGLAMLAYGGSAAAINVTNLQYDEANDKLVMTIAYRGTHDKHEFSVEWTECRPLDGTRSQILGVLIDSEPRDLARQEFSKPLEVDLSSFTCRPATVTIRTSAGFFASVDIPAAKQRTRSSVPASRTER